MDSWQQRKIVCLTTMSVEDVENVYIFGLLITGSSLIVWILVFDSVSRIWFMPQPAPCLTSLVPIVDPVSVLGLLSQPCPWIIQPEVTSYLRCGDHCLPPTEVSPLGFKFYSRQKQVSDFSDPCNIWRIYKSLIPLSAPVIPRSCAEFYLSDVFL
ncbi:hypothetical protein XENOCAPTIV_017172 [Xenoophorus captivus]|uniref:Uncharacterized protein n=1 Tax=Xenoophorus captivus TaxID=1517983 RepID=A0ABV0RQY8_9TELE